MIENRQRLMRYHYGICKWVSYEEEEVVRNRQKDIFCFLLCSPPVPIFIRRLRQPRAGISADFFSFISCKTHFINIHEPRKEKENVLLFSPSFSIEIFKFRHNNLLSWITLLLMWANLISCESSFYYYKLEVSKYHAMHIKIK